MEIIKENITNILLIGTSVGLGLISYFMIKNYSHVVNLNQKLEQKQTFKEIQTNILIEKQKYDLAMTKALNDECVNLVESNLELEQHNEQLEKKMVRLAKMVKNAKEVLSEKNDLIVNLKHDRNSVLEDNKQLLQDLITQIEDDKILVNSNELDSINDVIIAILDPEMKEVTWTNVYGQSLIYQKGNNIEYITFLEKFIINTLHPICRNSQDNNDLLIQISNSMVDYISNVM